MKRADMSEELCKKMDRAFESISEGYDVGTVLTASMMFTEGIIGSTLQLRQEDGFTDASMTPNEATKKLLEHLSELLQQRKTERTAGLNDLLQSLLGTI